MYCKKISQIKSSTFSFCPTILWNIEMVGRMRYAPTKTFLISEYSVLSTEYSPLKNYLANSPNKRFHFCTR